MMTNGGQILVSGVGGLIAGGIGAAVANSSRSFPVLKGALVVGLLDAALAAALVAGAESAKQVGTSGPPPRRFEPRFP
jgi:hypothetical protein